ncbi:uncharacterized membrane protein YoaT (DUF817 family) [Litoreibacter ponti]|uniref:Uncharacterized membrane protein YoaT (DUF817 family) n=1 Tax=Litoreibacter ponti TaxID=1510457 RepID=A0A2T6BK92_9RHOB|nr:DUF817 domain-containing protein [Litoreibacter ponti]PTX56478.1 uncharacterized membrane protein YoaT (DUF817 family) [Litoreibacter ponti]
MPRFSTRGIERRLGDGVRARLTGWPGELLMFFLKQGWAALFGLLFIVALIATKLVWQDDWTLQRYDGLFIFAVTTQAAMLWFKLETWDEARVILLFHITGTAMELFKIHMGSWSYPEPGLFVIGGVPLFSGFMYASIGSYIARVIRIFDMRFAPYPPLWLTFAFGAAIYVNFFAHHFLPDIRLALFAGTLILFGRTRIWFYVGRTPRWMPMPLAALLAAFVVWIAENVGTMTGTWIYAGQSALEMVSFAKMGSWYLLLWVAFVTVTLVSRGALSRAALKPGPRPSPSAPGTLD